MNHYEARRYLDNAFDVYRNQISEQGETPHREELMDLEEHVVRIVDQIFDEVK
jgi:hypothetical protein